MARSPRRAMSRFPRRPWFLGCALGFAFAGAALFPLSPSRAAEEGTNTGTAPTPPAAPKKKSAARPSTSQLLALINEQKALIEEQQRVIADLQARIDAQQGSREEQDAAIQAQTVRLAELEGQIAALNQRIDDLMAQIPGVEDRQALEERLRRIEEASAKVPELPPDYVKVDNLDFQLPEAYKRTNRFSVNVVLSPIDRIDIGVEYIYGSRENKDGETGTADQIQVVGIFRF